MTTTPRRGHARLIALFAFCALVLAGLPLLGSSAQAASGIEDPYFALTPTRVLDTRDGTGAPAGKVGANAKISVKVAGVAGVPATASAVALNVTVTEPTEAGFVTVHPSGGGLPLASNLNFVKDQTIPNMVIVKVGTSGSVDLYNKFGETHLVADVAGYFDDGKLSGGGAYEPLAPGRVLDTRGGVGAPAAPIGEGKSIDVKVTGTQGVPATGVSAVVLNLTVDNPTASSFLTAYPTGGDVPLASNLNFVKDEIFPNLAIVKVGTGGKVSLFNKFGTVNAIADVAGYFTTSGADTDDGFTALSPKRILDTRDGTGAGVGTVGGGESIDLKVTGTGGVPTTATAVVLNVTVDGPTASSFLTAFPKGTAQPVASNLNYVADEVFPNLVIVKVGTGGMVSLFNKFGETHMIADVAGFFSPGDSGTPPTTTPPTTEPPPAFSQTLYRVNNGGPEVAGMPAWSIDTAATPTPFLLNAGNGNAVSVSPGPIDVMGLPVGTPPELFLTERYDEVGPDMGFEFPVPAGTEVEVRLYFAETFGGTQAVGARVFDVAIDGTPLLTDFDIFAEVGANKGVVKATTITSDGVVDIDFTPGVENPKINAIEIITLAANPSVLVAAPAAVGFADTIATASSTNTLELKNLGAPGDPAIDVTGITIGGANPGAFTTDFVGPVSVPPGGSTSVTVTFSPATTGAKSATATIAHSGTNLATALLTGNSPATQAKETNVSIGLNGSISTFGAESTVIENRSSSGANITSVAFDISTAMLPDVLFDPDGVVGDNVAADLYFTGGTPGTGGSGDDKGTGYTSHAFGGASNGGFSTLTINFNDFAPGEKVNFGVDIDPLSIKGSAQPGPGSAGDISGLELAGSTVTVTYADSTVHTGTIFPIEGSSQAGQTTVIAAPTAAPVIADSIQGAGPAVLLAPGTRTINVTGAAGQTVKVFSMEAALYQQAGGGHMLDPFEANSSFTVATATVAADGSATIPVMTSVSPFPTLVSTMGLHHFIAAVDMGDGLMGLASNVIVLQTP